MHWTIEQALIRYYGMNFKNRSLILSFGLLIACLPLSCKKDGRTELFEMSHRVDFDLPPGLNTFDTHFFSVSPISSNYEAMLAAAGKTSADVVAIEAKDAYLSSTFGDVNLKFIHRISIYIFDPFNPDDRIEFFYLDPTQFKNATSWRLFPGITDITEWIERGFFGIEVRLELREVSPTFIPMRLEFDLRVMGE
jgi:hypothetical protein